MTVSTRGKRLIIGVVGLIPFTVLTLECLRSYRFEHGSVAVVHMIWYALGALLVLFGTVAMIIRPDDD